VVSGRSSSKNKEPEMAEERAVSMGIARNPVWRYTAACLATAAALAVGGTLKPILGDFTSAIVLFPAMAFAAWHCDVGPSILATVLTLLGVKYWLFPPLYPFSISALQALALATIVEVFAIVVFLGEARLRENDALRLEHGELEEKVGQRTAELDAANQRLRELTARLMQSQDDERRRIARELHDSVGQTLAALSMNLTKVETDIERLHQTARTIADSSTLVQEMNKEVRTISYLLHPPLLDEAGLKSALRWYVDGFTQRSGIKVDLEIAEDFGRLQSELETAVFRTVQECLTNVHRHSGSKTARVRLLRSARELRLQVEDDGGGMGAEKLDKVVSDGTPGVGIRGMRERLRQLGGTLEVNSSRTGTIVEVRVPPSVSSVAAA
jgi:signal transduction histidine kinase